MKKKLFVIVVLSFTLALSGCGGADRQETEESTVNEDVGSTSATTSAPDPIKSGKKDRGGYDEANNIKVQFWGHDLSVPSYWINSGSDSFDNYTYYADENGTIAAMMQFQCHSTGSMNRDNIESDFEDVLSSLADSLNDFNVLNSGTATFCDEDAYTADFICTMNDNTPMKCKVVTTKHNGSSNMYGFFLLQSEDSEYDYFGDFEKMLNSAMYGNSSDTDTSGTVATPSIQSYGPGTLKVGADIPAGEYIVISTENYGGYFSVNTDANGDDIVFNSMFDYNSIVTVNDGEYFEMSRAKAYPFDQWCAQNTIDLSNTGVMLKVGVNIPAGDYQLSADSEDAGYYCIYSSSRQDDIVANNLFEGQDYVSVSDGQYLELSRCTIVQ